ncbi:MAG TPA: hypothetical protein DC000_05965 [Clostridiales bacterium]|nr:hypothetical protein [Clostridiales bacterium]
MEDSMILSIGMIVKNEEKYLNECLAALKPLLDNLDSELIIIDTGSVDNTVEIAKKYTKNVYFFEWCNDFAAARNETLKYATGKWYMYIDADEILDDASELINFFKSKEYEKYEGAKYEIKSYRNDNKTSYSNILSYRIYKLNHDTRFLGTIHEYIPIPEKVKTLNNTVFNHYGYIFVNPKFTKAKAKRNIDLMLKEVEQKPDDPRLRSHIVDSYLLIDSYEEAINQAKIGIEICKRTKLNNYYCALQPNLIFSYIKLNDYLNAIDESLNYFKYTKMTLATDIDVYYFMTLAYYELKNYENCIDSYKKYINYVEKHRNKKLITFDLDLRSILCLDEIAINNTILMATYSYIQIQDYKNASKLLQQPSLENYNMIKNPSVYFNLQLELMKKTSNYISLLDLYNNTATENNKSFLPDLEYAIETFSNSSEDDKYKIITCTYVWNKKTDYILYIKIKYSLLYHNQYVKELLTEFCQSDIELKTYNIDILYYIIDNNLPITLIYGKANEKLLNSFVESLYNNYNDFIVKLLSYTYKPELIEENFLLSMIYENTLNILSTDNPEDMLKLYTSYIENLRQYISFTYNTNIINYDNLNYINLLPNNILAGYYCILAETSLLNNDKASYIKYLKLSLKTNEKNKNLISVLLDNFQEENKTEKPKSEFEILADTIKNNIKLLINSGNIIQAKEVLNEYVLINPNDSDIVNLKKLL